MTFIIIAEKIHYDKLIVRIKQPQKINHCYFEILKQKKEKRQISLPFLFQPLQQGIIRTLRYPS